MRLLTPSEKRQVEAIKKQIIELHASTCDPVEITVAFEQRELWLNLLAIVLETNDAMRLDWQKHHNPQSVRA